MLRKLFFVINPCAGKGKSKRVWEKVKAGLGSCAKSAEIEYGFTEGPGHAGILAKKAAHYGFDSVIAIGGDGTAGEAADGLAGTATALGIIPAGTGNDFIKTAGIPKNPIAALKRIVSGRRSAVDIGEINGRKFLNIASTGFDAEVAYLVHSGFRRFRAFAYLAAVAKALVSFNSGHVDLEIDGTHIGGDILLAAVCNGRYYGNGLMISPGAKTDDGLFDVVIVKKVPRFEIIKFLPIVFKGGHLHHPAVKVIRGKRICITAQKPLKIQADGEVLGTTPAYLELLPKKLIIIH